MSPLNWIRLIGFGVITLGLAGGYFFYLRPLQIKAAERDAMLVERDTAVNNLEAYKDLSKAKDDAFKRSLENERRINAEFEERIEEIRNAPAGDDGPVAPVLRRALDGLRPPAG